MLSFLALKLFVKPSQKTNRNLVLNAIQYCVLAGAVNEPTKQKVLTVCVVGSGMGFSVDMNTFFRSWPKAIASIFYCCSETRNVNSRLCTVGIKCRIRRTSCTDSGRLRFRRRQWILCSSKCFSFGLKRESWASLGKRPRPWEVAIQDWANPWPCPYIWVIHTPSLL